jgi:hypothetical protein
VITEIKRKWRNILVFIMRGRWKEKRGMQQEKAESIEINDRNSGICTLGMKIDMRVDSKGF